MDMNWKSLAAMLPVQPCDELKRDVLMGIYDKMMLTMST